jgi:hypothetical protein
MTRIGKIGRLPKAIQDQLNHRLGNNELGQPLLVWLNGLPEVRQIPRNPMQSHPVAVSNSQSHQNVFKKHDLGALTLSSPLKKDPVPAASGDAAYKSGANVPNL